MSMQQKFLIKFVVDASKKVLYAANIDALNTARAREIAMTRLAILRKRFGNEADKVIIDANGIHVEESFDTSFEIRSAA